MYGLGNKEALFMNTMLEKLMEIETVANKTVEAVAVKKQELARQLEEKKKSFDEQMETDTQQMLVKLRRQLELQKSEELKEMQTKACRANEELEHYYAENHERLAEEIFEKIIKV